MRNVKKERIEAKLKLWDTQGFSQFLEDLIQYCDIIDLRSSIKAIKKGYEADLMEINNKNSKFKQTKLDI